MDVTMNRISSGVTRSGEYEKGSLRTDAGLGVNVRVCQSLTKRVFGDPWMILAVSVGWAGAGIL